MFITNSYDLTFTKLHMIKTETAMYLSDESIIRV